MAHSDSLGKLAEALTKAQAIMKPAKKEAENPFFKSKYADLASVWEAVREPLTTHGLSVVQLPMATPDAEVICIQTMLLHTSGEWVSSELTMKPVKRDPPKHAPPDAKPFVDPQAIGSCLTYARRYALAAITGVASEEDDDGQTASVPPLMKQTATVPEANDGQTVSVPPPVKQTAAVPESTPGSAVPGSTGSSVHGGPANGFIWRLGKHKGTPLGMLPDDYLDWASRNMTNTEHKAAAIMELDRRNRQEIFAPDP